MVTIADIQGVITAVTVCVNDAVRHYFSTMTSINVFDLVSSTTTVNTFPPRFNMPKTATLSAAHLRLFCLYVPRQNNFHQVLYDQQIFHQLPKKDSGQSPDEFCGKKCRPIGINIKQICCRTCRRFQWEIFNQLTLNIPPQFTMAYLHYHSLTYRLI